MIIKVVLNKCYGGFGLSKEAFKWLAENGGVQGEDWKVKDYYNNHRDDKLLVQCVETLGEKANGAYAKLVVEEYVVTFDISSYDGRETLAVY